jgi:hypothetical protein
MIAILMETDAAEQSLTTTADNAVRTGKSVSPRRKTLVRQHATEEISPPAHPVVALSPTSFGGGSYGGGSYSGGSYGSDLPRRTAGTRIVPGLSISPTTGCSSTGSSFHSSPPAYKEEPLGTTFAFRPVSRGSRHQSPTTDDERSAGGRLPPVGWRPGCISHNSRALSADCRQPPAESYGVRGAASAGRLAVKRQKTAESAPSRVNSRLSSRQQSLSQGASKVTLIRGKETFSVMNYHMIIHCKKRLAIFPSLTKLSLGRKNLIIPVQGELGW